MPFVTEDMVQLLMGNCIVSVTVMTMNGDGGRARNRQNDRICFKRFSLCSRLQVIQTRFVQTRFVQTTLAPPSMDPFWRCLGTFDFALASYPGMGGGGRDAGCA